MESPVEQSAHCIEEACLRPEPKQCVVEDHLDLDVVDLGEDDSAWTNPSRLATILHATTWTSLLEVGLVAAPSPNQPLERNGVVRSGDVTGLLDGINSTKTSGHVNHQEKLLLGGLSRN